MHRGKETPLNKVSKIKQFHPEYLLMATIYTLSNLFRSVQNSDFPYIYPNLTMTNSQGVVRVIVTPDIVTDEEDAIFKMFLTALDVDTSAVDNYGLARYINDVSEGLCPAYFGVRDGVMGLLIGAETTQFETRSLFIPCEVKEQDKKVGKKMVRGFVYTLNETELRIIEDTDNDGKPNGKNYLAVDHTDDDGNEYTFIINILIDRSRNYEPGEINRAFKAGNFQSVVKEFKTGTGGGNIWLKSNKAFTRLFTSKTFPKEGVLILAKNGVIKVTEAGSRPRIEKDIIESEWQIIDSSHPELLVEYTDKDKVLQLVTLSEGTHIQFTAAANKNEGFNWLKDNAPDGYGNYVLIHIVAPAKTVEHTPVNTVTNILERIKIKINSSPKAKHLAEWLKTNSESFVSNSPKTKEISEEEARADLGGQYPKAFVPSNVPEIEFPEVPDAYDAVSADDEIPTDF